MGNNPHNPHTGLTAQSGTLCSSPWARTRRKGQMIRLGTDNSVQTSDLISDCNAAGATEHITRKIEPNHEIPNHFEVTDEE